MVKNLPANAGDARGTGSISGSGTCNGVGNGNHSSILPWIILRTEEPGGLQSLALHRDGQDRTQALKLHLAEGMHSFFFVF